MPRFLVSSLLGALVLLAAGTPARGQSLLRNPAVLAPVAGLNTVPDHGDAAVSFLDYRNAGYSIMVADLGSGTERQLERVSYAEPVVTTFGGRVAWIGYTPAGQPDVYVHDRATGATTRVTTDAAFQNHPDLSAGVLVWQDYRNAGAEGRNADVYLHDFASNATRPVTTDPGYQDLPRVHGSRVVWQDFRHASALLNTADIYAFDVATGQERRLTTGSFYRTHPSVWGALVVWEDYRNGSDGDIYLYDLSTDREVPVSTHVAHQERPSVYGEWVLWLDYRNGAEQGDLYGYHLGTGQEYALLVHPAHQDAPHVYGNRVVWQDYRDGRFDLFAATLPEPTGTAVEEAGPLPGLTFSAAPNPFKHSVAFALKDVPAGPLELEIYDALGRTVARRPLPSGEAVVAWDGVGDAGSSVAPGVYVAVVRGRDVLRRVVFVRQR